jgi:hypothetical protein
MPQHHHPHIIKLGKVSGIPLYLQMETIPGQDPVIKVEAHFHEMAQKFSMSRKISTYARRDAASAAKTLLANITEIAAEKHFTPCGDIYHPPLSEPVGNDPAQSPCWAAVQFRGGSLERLEAILRDGLAKRLQPAGHPAPASTSPCKSALTRILSRIPYGTHFGDHERN